MKCIIVTYLASKFWIFKQSIVQNKYCKVEFYQLSCWLYSVPNLLVFQQLVTLYLGGILVRVVSEIVWRNAQECARKTGTRDWISRVTHGYKPLEAAHVPGMPEVEAWCQLEHYKTKKDNRPFSYLAAGTCDSVKPRSSPVLKNLTLHIPFSPQYKYPFYPRKKESFQREFWERNPREKLDWFIPNLH